MNNQLDRARNIGLAERMTGNPGMATAAPRSTQVELMLSNLSEEIGFLEKTLELHMNKIAPVLRGEVPTADAGKAVPDKEYLVPVADSIRTMAERVSSARRRVENLTERTEA